MIGLGWLILRFLALLASFGAGWWFALLAAGLALATWRYRERQVVVVSALAGVISAVLWVALIPSTTGSEAVLGVLALMSVAIAIGSSRRLPKRRVETVEIT